MAATLKQIEQFLKQHGLAYEVQEDPDRIAFGFGTDSYRDIHGDRGILLIVQLDEDGEYFKLFAPRCYMYPAGPHREAVFQACLMISWQTKMVQFEYDPSDGEIRAIIEFPLEDAMLTERQFMRCVGTLVRVIDDKDDLVRTAIHTGRIADHTDPPQFMQEFSEYMEHRLRENDDDDMLQGPHPPPNPDDDDFGTPPVL